MIGTQKQRRGSSWDKQQSERRRSSIQQLAKPTFPHDRPSKPQGPHISPEKIKMIS